jgi:hypothetical protein
MHQITKGKITHVSLVNKAANGKTFMMLKSDDGAEPSLQKSVDFTNIDKEKQLVYGVVYTPDEVDLQGDYATAEVIEDMAHEFIAKHRSIDLEHNYKISDEYGEVVESYIAPSDLKIADTEVKKGAWVLVTKATESIWEDIKKGNITGYSMAGLCNKVQKNDTTTSNDDTVMDKLIKKIEGLLNPKKENKSMTMEEMSFLAKSITEPILKALETTPVVAPVVAPVVTIEQQMEDLKKSFVDAINKNNQSISEVIENITKSVEEMKAVNTHSNQVHTPVHVQKSTTFTTEQVGDPKWN